MTRSLHTRNGQATVPASRPFDSRGPATLFDVRRSMFLPASEKNKLAKPTDPP